MQPVLRPLALMISLIGAGAAHGEVVMEPETSVFVLDDWAPGETPGVSVTTWVHEVAPPAASVERVVARVPERPVSRPKVRRLARLPATPRVIRTAQEAIERIERIEVAASWSPPGVAEAMAAGTSLASHTDAGTPSPAKWERAGVRVGGSAAASNEVATPTTLTPRPLPRSGRGSPSVSQVRERCVVAQGPGAQIGDDNCASGTPAPDHAARILAMLAGEAQPAAAPADPVEDGPTKRARKLAARAAREALAAGVVDLPLPLETDTRQHVAPFGNAAPPVAAATLDGVRGGYSGGGLNVSFGIERAVYINGALVTTTSFNVVSGTAGAQAAIDAAATALVQNGAANHAGAMGSTAGTVVQNSVDGQAIRSVTTINATVNSAGIYRGLNLGASMRGAVIDSLRR